MKEELQACKVLFPDSIGSVTVVGVDVVKDRRLIITLHAKTPLKIVNLIGSLPKLRRHAFPLTVSCFQGQQKKFGKCVLRRQRPVTGLLGRVASRADEAIPEPFEFVFKVYPTG